MPDTLRGTVIVAVSAPLAVAPGPWLVAVRCYCSLSVHVVHVMLMSPFFLPLATPADVTRCPGAMCDYAPHFPASWHSRLMFFPCGPRGCRLLILPQSEGVALDGLLLFLMLSFVFCHLSSWPLIGLLTDIFCSRPLWFIAPA
jgi:hypothetical protein